MPTCYTLADDDYLWQVYQVKKYYRKISTSVESTGNGINRVSASGVA